MGDDYAVIKIEGKAVDTFVKRVSKFVGGVFRPKQIRRVAEAEADRSRIAAQAEVDAELIRVKGGIEIADVLQRAKTRITADELRNQENLESVAGKALQYVNETARPNEVDDDFLANLFDKARLVSDDAVQQLFAKILAGEVNSPGKYSKRTVNALADLDVRDAGHLSTLCRFCWKSDALFPVVTSMTGSPLYHEYGLEEQVLIHLHQIGLTTLFTERYAEEGFPKRAVVSYFDDPILLEFSRDERNQLPVGHVIFTEVGKQLAALCSATPIEEFRIATLAYWQRMGVTILPADAPQTSAVAVR